MGWLRRLLGWAWLLGLRWGRRWAPLARAGDSAPRSLPGTEPFLLGANLPWLSYGNDFGRSEWQPQGGVASGDGQDRLAGALAGLADQGIRCLRWFLFADGRSGIRTDAAGCPLGLDDRVFPDLDRAVATAERAGVKLLFVVFDFHLGLAARWHQQVKLGGRSRWITDGTQRTALLTHVLAPLWHRYGHHPAILGWDLFNEPEWITSGLGGRDPLTSVPPWRMRRFLAEMTGMAHRLTDQLTTVGLVTSRGLPLVRGLGLDLFQVHWYDRFERQNPLDRPVRRFHLDRPLILGEYPSHHSARAPGEIVTTARRNGYAGALAWSLLGRDPASRTDSGEPDPPPA